jgi:hypothetical protein
MDSPAVGAPHDYRATDPRMDSAAMSVAWGSVAFPNAGVNSWGAAPAGATVQLSSAFARHRRGLGAAASRCGH